MKALHVFYRIFHYVAVWCLILAVVALGLGFYYCSALVISEEFELVDIAAYGYLFGLAAAGLVVFGLVQWATAHVFKQALRLTEKKVAAEEEECECCCCKCEKEEPVSDLDAQVNEVMKWKNLYVEGIITEREFIDKRNEILRISK